MVSNEKSSCCWLVPMQRVRSEEKLTVDPVFKPGPILGAKSLRLNIQMSALVLKYLLHWSKRSLRKVLQASVLSFTVWIWKLCISSQECRSRKDLWSLSSPVSEHHLWQQFPLGRAWRRELGLSFWRGCKVCKLCTELGERDAGGTRQSLGGMTSCPGREQKHQWSYLMAKTLNSWLGWKGFWLNSQFMEHDQATSGTL